MIRHFAEKQHREGQDGVERHESFQYVPEMFEGIIEETLENVRRIADPLRGRLRAQTETGRVFPEYELSDLMPAPDFFARLFGSLHIREDPLPPDLVERYLQTWDVALLDRIRSAQARSTSPLRVAIENKTWSRLNAERPLPQPLHSNGRPWVRGRIPWLDSFFRVDHLEKWVSVNIPTKLPDRYPVPLAGGDKFPRSRCSSSRRSAPCSRIGTVGCATSGLLRCWSRRAHRPSVAARWPPGNLPFPEVRTNRGGPLAFADQPLTSPPAEHRAVQAGHFGPHHHEALRAQKRPPEL